MRSFAYALFDCALVRPDLYEVFVIRLPTNVELDEPWAYECRIQSILGLRMLNSSNLRPMSVELKKSWAYECRACAILDL